MNESASPLRRIEADSAIGYQPIYLDHHATTPVDPRVVAVVVDAMSRDFGNAASADHVFGERALAIVEEATELVAGMVGAACDAVRFTSGSTEAIRIAVAHAVATKPRLRRLRVACTRVEHQAVLDALTLAERNGVAETVWIDVGGDGQLDGPSVDAALSGGVDLFCVMAANNEVGTIYPIEPLAARARAVGARILVDATQSAGRTQLRVEDWQLDYVALSAHKIYGPKGVGALVCRDPSLQSEVGELVVGHQGTMNVPGIAGFGEACRLMSELGPTENIRIAALRDRLENLLRRAIPALVVSGANGPRLPHNLHIAVPGVPNDAVIARLRGRLAISTGAACSSGALTPSHVLRAMGVADCVQEGSLRIGIGRYNTSDEIDRAASDIAEAVRGVQSMVSGK